MRRIVPVLLAWVAIAHAGDGIPVELEIGKRVERRVGNAIGWFCDDPSLIQGELVTRGDTNVWVVVGVKAGTTQCRVGTDVTRASFVFAVTVRPARPRR